MAVWEGVGVAATELFVCGGLSEKHTLIFDYKF